MSDTTLSTTSKPTTVADPSARIQEAQENHAAELKLVEELQSRRDEINEQIKVHKAKAAAWKSMLPIKRTPKVVS